MKCDPRQSLGKKAERLAAQHLKNKGYRILGQNVKNSLGEIDIVASKFDTLVFVEVKAGQILPGFSPMDHFTQAKKKHLLTLGKLYLCDYDPNQNARFDLISVTQQDKQFEIEHFEDVIEDSYL